MANKRRILLLTSSYPSACSGPYAFAGIFVRHFAMELAKRAEVFVLTQQVYNGSTAVCDEGVNVIRFPWAGGAVPLSMLRLPKDSLSVFSVLTKGAFSSLRIARRYRFDLSLAMWAIPSGLWALLLKRICGIQYAVWCLGSDVWDSKTRLRKGLLRSVLVNARALYADGYRLKEEVERLSRKKCSFMATSRRLPVERSEKPDLPADKRNYLFIGRYHPNKGPDILLEAVARLERPIRERVHFHMFGDGPLKTLLSNLVRERNLSEFVTLGGGIDERGAVSYLKNCEALIIPSRIESIPVILSDALQTGCHIIATDVGDVGRLLREFGAGIVVSPESPAELAQSIREDLLYPQEYREGQKNLLELFDLSKTVEGFFLDHFKDYHEG